MKAVSIWNIKGGVGKTTTALTLVTELAKRGKKVLAIDIDPQGNLSQFFLKDKRKEEHFVCMTDLFTGKHRPELVQQSVHHVNKNIDVIGSTLGLANAEITVRSSICNQSTILENILKDVMREYDYVLIDCPPTLNLLTINAMLVANEVIIPINVDEWAEEGFLHTVSNIQDINDSFAKIIKYKVLFTMLNRSNIDCQIMDSIKNKLQKENYYCSTIRYQSKPIKEAKKQEKTVINTKSNVGLDYKRFVDEFEGEK